MWVGADRKQVITDRAHGFSSQMEGEVEVMLHRNPNMTDNFGQYNGWTVCNNALTTIQGQGSQT